MIEFRNITLQRGTHRALDSVSLTVAAGTICALVGPSGAGKTSLLRLVNRLLIPDSGTVFVDGVDIATIDEVQLRRRLGWVVQEVGLFPHLSVARNIAMVPELLHWPQAKIDARVDELLQLVGLDPAQMRDRAPRNLSGGERQRVGVARALAADPPHVLMDEPFGAVDPLRRSELQRDLIGLLRRLQKTVLLVTHDIDEALQVADRLALLRDGSLVQAGPPASLLLAPSDSFVAAFLGSDRILKLLALHPAQHLVEPGRAVHPIATDATARDALETMLSLNVDEVALGSGRVTLAAIRAVAAGQAGG
ncbi:ABC transporter ATP-binding protein [Roseiterribacter gracilis]|uniref:ATP-binding protein n=1 Tax=Roseiterribacter gracilis TaxID=2812848 RepID=A0A8S8XAS1_9PROT|nr:ATP-binding protein [Rhodospirillales bacterium TMPK1]